MRTGMGWLLLAAACALPVSAQPGADLEKVARQYNGWATSVRSVTGSGKAWVWAPGQRERTFEFSLAATRPGSIRLQGRWGNLTTLFDLASTEDGWTLLLPRDRTFARAGAGEPTPGLLVAPRDLLSALLPYELGLSHVMNAGAVARDERGLRLVVPPRAGSPHRVLWLDPATLVPRRVELRRESQLEVPLLVFTYEDVKLVDDVLVPHAVRLESPGGGWGRFAFRSLKLNRDLDARRFSILIPRGAKETRIESVDPGFLPESEGDSR